MSATVKLGGILSIRLLSKMLLDGYVRRQVHPTLPLEIYNYTEKVTHDAMWNEVTLSCRGLIVDTVTGQVAARPFRKFFNHGQTGAPVLDLDARVSVTDKQDGSLGIIYPTPDGYAVATRGSFASEQAIHATEVLRTRYADWSPPPGLTVLVEIVYPQNRIVVNYGDLDDLVLLGAVEIATGRSYGPGAVRSWPGPRTTVFDYQTVGEALAAPPRPNAEGLVLHLHSTDERVKIKQDDYVALHRIVTGLSARTVWQHLMDGKPLDELIEPLPDEFHEWVRTTAEGIRSSVYEQTMRHVRTYDDLVDSMPAGWDWTSRDGRRDFAGKVFGHPDSWAMFALLDGRSITAELLKRAKPEPYVTPAGRQYGEDTA